MASMLVETLAGDFDPDEYEDDYREAVEALVKAKIEGGEVKSAPAAKKSTGEVIDLLAALQRSVDAAKTARGESTDDAPAAKKSAPRAAKKTAKKASTAAKKGTAAKKTSKTAKKAVKKSAKKAS
ncbi:hypothetical protein ABIE44_002972 [Marmoricola sp. OAE513]|uniref:hypothetical protein n=1 Tax=Marmoricola sp. OAE513 TaxID=2817894 RepID=UPI003396D9D5